MNDMAEAIKIFIVDDHPMVIDALKGYLEDETKYHIVGTASHGKAALVLLEDTEVDVVLTDIQMPQMDGVELTKELNGRGSEYKVIALTMFNEPQLIKRMLQAGVMGYVLKNSSMQEIERAIAEVASGRQYYSPEVTDVIMNKLRGTPLKTPLAANASLTDRELEILHLILKQNSNQEIAERLFISSRTVEAHKRNMLEKTGSKNVAGLVLYAVDHQLFEDF